MIDVVAEAGVPNLLNRGVIPLRGEESCRVVYFALVEDLMYRHDQEVKVSRTAGNSRLASIMTSRANLPTRMQATN